MMNTGNIDALVEAILPDIIEWRHRLHRIPEIAGQERQTAALIREALAETPIVWHTPLLETDVIGDLAGARPGRHVALRADMDALPLEEQNDLPYRSEHPGMMHACGHDGHMAMLIGAARVLSQMRQEVSGSIRFIFQPGEEVRSMGKELVEAGVLEQPKIDFVAALHGWPETPVGVIATRPGAIMASAAHFTIRIFGRGGHGSAPEQTVDPLVTGCMAVSALQTIVSRNFDPQDAAVLSVCRFVAGNSSNVIPDSAELNGTCRALSPEAAARFEPAIRRIMDGICAATGASCEIDYRENYRVTVNAESAFHLAEEAAKSVLGQEFFQKLDRPAMAAEDFSYYLERCPGIYARIGMGMDSPGLHHPRYNFNDAALGNGIRFLVAVALAAGRQ